MIDIDAGKATVLLRHLTRAAKKFAAREHAHTELGMQLDRIRELAYSGNGTQTNNAVDTLEKRFSQVLEVEKEIISHQRFEVAYSGLLRERLDSLDKDIKEIEKAVKPKKIPTARQRALSKTKKQLGRLESRFNKLQRMKKFDKKALKAVQEKIKRIRSEISRH